MSSDLAANINNNSVLSDISLPLSNNIFLIFSPVSVEPGSLKTSTVYLFFSRKSFKRFICVDFPTPLFLQKIESSFI